MNTDLSRSFKESVGKEVEEFISRVKSIYSTHQTEFEQSGNEVFDSIMNLVIPSFKEDNTNNSTILTNFLQATLDQEAEKNHEKKYCAKDVVQISGITNLFGSPGSAFVSHISNRDSLASSRPAFSFTTPISGENSPSQKIITPQIVKKETFKNYENIKSDSDCLGKNSHGTKKQYKVYSPELKTEIVDYASKNGMREASEKYQVSTSKISIWSKSFTKSKQTRGRKTVDPEMEDKVCEWLEEELDKGSVLTQRIIREKAKTISVLENFKASKGWLEKFFKRRPALFEAYSLNRQGHLENLEVNEMNKQEEEIKKEGEDESESVSSSEKNDINQ